MSYWLKGTEINPFSTLWGQSVCASLINQRLMSCNILLTVQLMGRR